MFYSFSVFDTLVTYTTATSQGLFAIQQECLQKDKKFVGISAYVRMNFYELRMYAVELAKSRYIKEGVEDVTLKQIYEAIGTTGNLSMSEQQDLMELERSLICRHTVGIDKNIRYIKYLLENGQKVVLISDTCLDVATIRKMLLHIDKSFAQLTIYTSAECKKKKYTGNLYRLVQKMEGVEYSQWIHCGQDGYADIQMPSAVGIQTKSFSYKELKPIESQCISAHEDDSALQLQIGAARNARLLCGLEGAASMGATIAGPIIFPYVQWILNECGRMGIHRLYFIARDGYLTKKIADILIQAWNLDISTYYIYGSRRAWRMPAYDGKKGRLQRLISWSTPEKVKSLKVLATILQVRGDELLSFLPDNYLNLDEEFSYKTLCGIVFYLDEQIAFREFLLEKMAGKRKLVVDYLRQEVDVSDEKFAFVELDGGGLTQECFAYLMGSVCEYEVRTFYFKMDRLNFIRTGSAYNFFPSQMKGTLVLEMICRAPHGQTEGYRNVAGNIMPVLKDGEGEVILAHGYNDYVEGVKAFTMQYMSNVSAVSIKWALQYMRFIIERPDTETLDFFAEIPNSVTGMEKHVLAFAPRLTRNQIRNIFLLYPEKSWKNYYEGTDLDFAQLRCTDKEKKKIEFYQKHRDIIVKRFECLWHRPMVKTVKYGMQLTGFPYRLLGHDFVIYGAGKFGREVYKAACVEGCNIIGWVDKNYAKLLADGVTVTGTPESLLTLDYDKILVALLDTDISKDVQQKLIKMGIEEEKIIMLNMFDFYLYI